MKIMYLENDALRTHLEKTAEDMINFIMGNPDLQIMENTACYLCIPGLREMKADNLKMVLDFIKAIQQEPALNKILQDSYDLPYHTTECWENEIRETLELGEDSNINPNEILSYISNPNIDTCDMCFAITNAWRDYKEDHEEE